MIWGRNVKSHILLLKKCQNNFIKILCNLPIYVYISTHFLLSKILSIKQIYNLRILLFLYKIISLKKYTFFHKFLNESSLIVNKITRHTPTFYIFPYRTIIYSHSLFVYGTKLWSLLPKNYNVCKYQYL